MTMVQISECLLTLHVMTQRQGWLSAFAAIKEEWKHGRELGG